MNIFDNLDYGEIKERIIGYISEFCKHKPVIIGLSEGIDSSIVCALAIEALGEDKVKALIVKNSRYSQEGLQTARNYAAEHNLKVQEVDTEDMRRYAIKSLNINENDIIQTFHPRCTDL